jgi:hypothetical protein
MQLNKIDGGTFDNDTKACFDRIFLISSSRHLGVQASACHIHAELLLKASCAVETQADISDQPYSSSD